MSLFPQSKLAWKLTRIVVLVALVVGIILNLLQISRDFVNEEKRAGRITDQIIKSFLPAAVEAAYKLDKEGADEIVNGLLQYDFIESVEIIDDSQNILAVGEARSAEQSTTLWLTKTIFTEYFKKRVDLTRQEGGYPYGELVIKASNDRLYAELYERSLGVFIIGLARNLFLSCVLLAIFYYLLTRPLSKIAAFITSFHPEKNRGERLPKIDGHEDDEMGDIIDRLNSYIANNENHLTQIQNAQKEIEEKGKYLQSILTTTVEGFLRIDEQNIIRDTNPSIENILGLSVDEIVGKDIFALITQKDREILIYQQQMRREGQQSSYLLSFIDSSGTEIPCLVSATPTYDDANQFSGAFAFITNVRDTVEAEKEKKRLEAELYQARKMESIGTLAGGIAHDFNNLLAAIMGYTELAREEVDSSSPVREDLNEVIVAAKRGKELVQQILDFSKQSETEPIVIDAQIIVDEAVKILRPSLPANIEIVRKREDSTEYVLIDPVKFQQVILNLCTNAYHAMEKNGGKLTIELKSAPAWNKNLLSTQLVHSKPHIHLTISDTGAGIAAEIQDRIFDPFFSTKEVGKGTGMGLAIIHGIVQDSGGWIEVESEVGVGSTFHIFLPRHDGRAEDSFATEEDSLLGTEHVLLVDDEQPIINIGSRYLQHAGYQVTSSCSSFEALAQFRDSPAIFDAVITDYTMPGLSGVELASRMLEIRADIPIILITGYNAAISGEVLRKSGIKGFAFKPLSNKEMGSLLRKILDGEEVLPEI